MWSLLLQAIICFTC